VPPKRQRIPVAVAAFAAGTQALLAQTLLLREELLLYGGNEIAVGAFLGMWLAGIGAGALAMRRFTAGAERLAPPLLVLLGLLPLAAVALARLARGAAGIPAYEPFPLTLLLLFSLPVAAPVALVTGALVPSLAAKARSAGGSVSEIYVAEALGSLVGGVGASLLLAAGVEAVMLAAAGSALGALGAAAAARQRDRPALVVLALLLLPAALLLGPRLDRQLRAGHLQTVLPGATLLDYADTASSALALAELRGEEVLLIDGRVTAAFPDPERVEPAAGVLAALTGAPSRLLVIGREAVDLLPGVLALEALEKVVWVIPDPGLAEFVSRHVPGLASDGRLEVLVGDPIRSRGALERAGAFDAVWLMVGTPMSRSDDRFLTRETLRALAGLLSPTGVLAVPVRSAENYVGARLRLALGTVVAGVAEALPELRLVPGEDALVLGARTPAALELDPSVLAQRYTAMRPQEPRLTRGSFESLLDPRRVQRADSLVDSLRRDPAVLASRLDQPLALFNNLLVRAEQESETLTDLLETLRRTSGALWAPLAFLAVFPLAGVALKRRPAEAAGSAGMAVLAAGGAIGMGLDLLLLHLYQGRFGTLYLEVGFLFGLWMGGLALGSHAGRLLCAGRGPFAVGLSTLACLAGTAALVAAAGGSLAYGRAAGAAAFAAAGTLCGILIPVSEALLARAGIVGARAGVGIEAADHLGGAACALALGVLAIPILGLAHAAWLVAGLAGLAAACLVIALVRERALLPATLERRLARATRYQSFPYRRAALWLSAIATASVVGHASVAHLLLGPRIHLDERLLAESQLTPPWREESRPFVHYRSEAPEDGGLAFASRAAAPRVQGYGGPLGLLVTADARGRIRRVAFLEHSETPSYVEAADRFFSALEGKSLLAPIDVRTSAPGFEPSDAERSKASSAQPVDAISGATVTSRAVARALEDSGRMLAEPVFGRPYAGEARGARLTEPRYLYLALSLLLLPAVFLYAGCWLRRLWLVLHAALGGIWLGVQLSTVQALSWLRLEPELNLLTFTGLLAALIALAALAGPLYCGYLCPAGALQELLGHVGRARRAPVKLDQLARFAKYALLAALITGSLAFGSQSILHLDLLRELWAEKRSGLGVALIALVAAGSLLVPRFGCRYLCPTGALLNLLGKWAPLRRLLPAKKYAACDFGVRGAPDVDCLQCNRCLVGERVGPASPRRANALLAALAASVLLMAIFALPSDEGAELATSLEPQVRSVDVSRTKALTAAGHLSDKRAEYWHVVRGKREQAE